jgi:DNA ligase-1
MKYSKLCEIYQQLEKSPSRLKKTEILAKFLDSIKEKIEENPSIIYLLQGRVWPDYEEKEFGISGQISIKAISKASGKTESEVIKKWKKIGDLGEVAQDLIKNKSQATLFSSALTTEKIISNLKKLPEMEGKGAIEKKIGLISELLANASEIESKYIIRTLLNDLRIGVGSGVLRDAIVESCLEKEDKESTELVQSAYDKITDFQLVFKKAIKGKEALRKIEFGPGQPLKVMLALKAENIEDGFERCKDQDGKIALEFKYDGFRMLINKDEGGVIRIFTRRLDEVTKQFPEVKEYVQKFIKAKTFIIDAEAVGYDKKTKKYLPFQNISQRIKRKYDIEKISQELPVEINAFDLLYINGESLIELPFKTRAEKLREIIKDEKYKLRSSEQLITSSNEQAEKFYKKALEEGEEGVMIKNLNSPYKPGARVGYMLKLKPTSNEFDLVIIGAEYGTGKRAGWLTSFDLGCRDSDTGEILEIGKVSTGIKEKSEEGTSYEILTGLLKPLITSESEKTVKIKPKVVVTIVYQEIQKSPSYSSGYALRFPRFSSLREDRSIEDIASIYEIEREFKKMARK